MKLLPFLELQNLSIYFIASLVVSNAKNDQLKVSRRFPFCVTGDQFIKYQSNLMKGPEFAKFLTHQATDRDAVRNQGGCLNCGSDKTGGLIESIKYFRIQAEAVVPAIPVLRQWFHIVVKTHQPCEGLIVQSIGSPLALPHGQFDLEFGCTDCSDPDIHLDDAEDGEALGLRGQAAIIPCNKRTYLHARHPNVYAYASSTKRDLFHLNFNFVDFPCRLVSFFQFMILAVESFSGSTVSPNADYFHSSIIDHDFVDSVGGVPYPTHVMMRNGLACHVPDDQLPKDEYKLNFRMAINGNITWLYYSMDFDDCTLDTGTDWIDTKDAISDLICKLPERTKCDFNSSVSIPPMRTAPSQVTVLSMKPCLLCEDVYVRHSNLTKRLIRKGYFGNRMHGVSMIVGCIGILTVSIHISRYFKEHGGGCILVGWWLWTHLFLTFLSLVLVWIGIGGAIGAPARVNNPKENPVIGSKRELLIRNHKIFGSFSVLLFHVVFVCGCVRPFGDLARWILICIHVFGGYLTVILSGLAVISSTSCRDVKIFTVLLICAPGIPWFVAFSLQVVIDLVKPMRPRRSYFPMIEAVQFPRLKIPRFIILGFLSCMNFVLMLLMITNGSYKGLFTRNPCANCRWKYDEWVPVTNGSSVKLVFMWEHFKCKYNHHLWNSDLSLN